jgi:anti-sigma B factor antagonist
MSQLESFSPRRSPTAVAIDQRRLDDRTAVVAVAGEVDLSSAPRLKQTLSELLREGRSQLVLDLSRVSFLDSTALSVLVGIQRRLADDERLAIAGPGSDVLQVLKVSGLAASFHVFQTVDAALAYARSGTVAPRPAVGIAFSGDAALLVGIASTALPFAQSAVDEAGRWLRALRTHGAAGAVLASIGVSEAPIRELRNDPGQRPRHGDPDVIAAVTDHAHRIAAQRKSATITTTDVLLAVMHVYGADFDRVLEAHGADVDELVARLAVVDSGIAER